MSHNESKINKMRVEIMDQTSGGVGAGCEKFEIYCSEIERIKKTYDSMHFRKGRRSDLEDR